MIRSKSSIVMALVLCASGCTVGPNYKRPDLNVPTAYRGLPSGAPKQPDWPRFPPAGHPPGGR